MGVKKFCLSIRRRYCTPVKLLPVIFKAESLPELDLKNFILDQKAIERIPLSKHLKILHLERVYIDDDTFQKIIYPPSLETIKITCSIVSFNKGVDFRNLNVLHLGTIDSPLDHLLSCKFPILKRLTLSYCGGLKESHICIDAPNIIYFKYVGDFIPSISFATTSSKWDSDIYVSSDNAASPSWFIKLKKLIKSISQSDICLRIRYHCTRYDEDIIQENIVVQDDACNKPIAVESLELNCDLSCFSTLLNGLFHICRPRNIGDMVYVSWGKKVTQYLWKILMQRDSGDQDQFRDELWFRDLEQVSLQMKEMNGKEWHPISLSELSIYRQQWGYVRRKQWGYDHPIRFALKWRRTL